jgi:putative ABC transport system permease protein
VLRATLASVRAHALRLLATSLAVVVGVAFVTGTLVLSDTLRATFLRLFDQTTRGVDLVVQGPEDQADPLTGQRPPVPAALVPAVEAVDGVAAVVPEVQGFAQLVLDGEAAGGFGPPTIGIGAPASDALDTPEVREGRFPTSPDEIAIDAGTAAAEQVAVGDVVGLVTEGPVRDVTVVGTVGYGDLDNLAGATLVVLDTATAVGLYGRDGYTVLNVLAAEDADLDRVRRALTAVAGEDLEVSTRQQAVDQAAAGIGEGLSFFTTALLVFAGVALFVGAFLIANTFSIVVAQRTRELALLRAVGATRRQVMASVLGEALVTGAVGALGGFGLGIGLATGLYALLDAFGISLPEGDLVVTGGTFAVSAALGVLLTTASAVVPAARATRVAPVAALQAVAAPPPPGSGRVRYGAGALVAVLGVGGMAVALAGEAGIGPVGGAAVVTLLGASLLAPLVTRPLLAALGRPVSATRGIRGQLATENALRNPRRTAATASALMIGLSLVSFIAIMGASFTRSVEATLERTFAADLQISPAGFIPGLGDPGDQLAVDLAAVEGVDVVAVQRFAAGHIGEEEAFVAAFEPDQVAQVLTVEVVEGGDGGLLATGLAASDDVAERLDLSVGDELVLEVAGTEVPLVLGAVYEATPLVSGWVADVARVPGHPAFGGILVELADGADAAAVRARVEALLAPHPTLELRDTTEVREEIGGQVDQLLGLVTALLGLSVLVALFGIVNTLGLSVVERTRELGLLRAVGASRSQVRSMIRWESVLIALLGAVFGVVLGVLFAAVVVAALAEAVGMELDVPGGQLVAGVLAAGLAGVLAAVLPARRASRVDVLRALEAG